MKRPTHSGAFTGLLTAVLATGLATVCPMATAPAHADAAVAQPLTVVSQQFEVAADGIFVVDLGLPATVQLTDLADATVRVTAFARMTTRAAVQAVLDGSLPRQVDSVQIPTAGLPSNASADLEVVVPIETDVRTVAALQLARAGVYPLKVEIISHSVVVATVTTFVLRLEDDSEQEVLPLQVTAVAGTTQPVSVDDSTEVVLDSNSLDELSALADVLLRSEMPVTVRVAPAVVAAAAADEGEGAPIAAALQEALADDDLVAQPVLPIDPSAAAAASPERYTVWLREGEDELAAIAAEPASRSVAFVDHPISAAGAALVRDLGARLLVATPEVWETLAPQELTGLNQGAVLNLSVGGGSLPMTVVDPVIAKRIADGRDRPALTAIIIAAELSALREELADAGENPNTHAVVIGTADLGVPDATVFTAVTNLLTMTEGLQVVHTDQLGLRSATITDTAGAPLSAVLPDQAATDIGARVNLATALRNEAQDVATMLPTGADRPSEWNRLSDRLVTEAMTDDQAARLAGQIRIELASIRNAVELPDAFSFTLTGRRSTVRVKLGNTGPDPLTVQVRLISSKLLFPDGPQTVTLEPGQVTEVKVDIEARTNGKIPVTLEVYTPNGRTRLGFPVPLSARVSALSGLGNLVTGALALVLLTWWVRHVRNNRRARAAAEAAGRHPVRAPRSDGSALSPDAEASTLPDS